MANNDNAANVKIEGEMHLVITGRVAPQYIEHNGNSQIISVVEIGTSNIPKAISSAGKDLDNIGMVSLDQLFCPYMIGAAWATHALLPYWDMPAVSAAGITATDLNPFNPGMAMVDAATFYAEGPNVALYNSVEILNGEQIGDADFSQYKNIHPNGNLELNSVKGVGFKTPIILTGWGYDTAGKPVPADSVDPDAFAADAFRNPIKWKSGPLDVRWDDDRKVWTGGGSSGGGHTIWFTIDEILCPETDYVAETTLIVTATYYNQSCTEAPPGANYEGTYDVYDICNYLYGLATSDLVGTTGRASYMYPLTGACEPRWIIDDLCAQPEC